MKRKFYNFKKIKKHAHSIIPGLSGLLGKRPEMYLPLIWPTYFSKSKGCKIEDLGGKRYFDMTMGVGTNILGYANNEVDLPPAFLSVAPGPNDARSTRDGNESGRFGVSCLSCSLGVQ